MTWNAIQYTNHACSISGHVRAPSTTMDLIAEKMNDITYHFFSAVWNVGWNTSNGLLVAVGCNCVAGNSTYSSHMSRHWRVLGLGRGTNTCRQNKQEQSWPATLASVQHISMVITLWSHRSRTDLCKKIASTRIAYATFSFVELYCTRWCTCNRSTVWPGAGGTVRRIARQRTVYGCRVSGLEFRIRGKILSTTMSSSTRRKLFMDRVGHITSRGISRLKPRDTQLLEKPRHSKWLSPEKIVSSSAMMKIGFLARWRVIHDMWHERRLLINGCKFALGPYPAGAMCTHLWILDLIKKVETIPDCSENIHGQSTGFIHWKIFKKWQSQKKALSFSTSAHCPVMRETKETGLLPA